MIMMRDWGFYSRLAIPCDQSDRELIAACHDAFGKQFRTRMFRNDRHKIIRKMLNIHHSMQLTS